MCGDLINDRRSLIRVGEPLNTHTQSSAVKISTRANYDKRRAFNLIQFYGMRQLQYCETSNVLSAWVFVVIKLGSAGIKLLIALTFYVCPA